MSLEGAKENCLGWAARDISGFLSPYKFSRRTPGNEDVWITITYCGICYADVIWTRNKHGDSKYPVVPGHEIVGIVREVGPNVDRFKVGDHVGVGAYVDSCRHCECCDDGLEAFCSSGATFTYNHIDKDGTTTKGGYSNHIVVQERYCYKIPESCPLEKAAPLLCAGITVYAPMVRHNMNQPGKSLGVIGLGGLGHMAVKFGKVFGLKVTLISTSESKRSDAQILLGADEFVISSDEQKMKIVNLVKQIKRVYSFPNITDLGHTSQLLPLMEMRTGIDCFFKFISFLALAGALDFIVDTASGVHPFDPYMSLLKTAGVLVLVGAPSEVKLSPLSLLLGKYPGFGNTFLQNY